MSDLAWIDSALTAARPQAIGALLRYFRDLDLAEEAFQDASLRALRNWPQQGPPRDPAAWLIMVGRNAAIDQVRRRSRQQALPDEDAISDLDDVEAPLAERLDGAHYRDDVLRLLFICCHPGLPATQQIALALRIVSGLSVQQIARAFVVGEAAMEQRITRAKARIAKAGVPFETPGPGERAERLAAVAAMIYLVFNEGYSAGAPDERASLAVEAIRLARLLLRLFPAEPEIMGLLALMLLHHSAHRGRDRGSDAAGEIVLLEDQDRRDVGPAADQRGPGADRQGRPPSPARALSGQGRHRRYPARRTATAEGDRPSRSANSRRAGSGGAVAHRDAQPGGGGLQDQGPGAGGGAEDRSSTPLHGQLAGYFYFHGSSRARC